LSAPGSIKNAPSLPIDPKIRRRNIVGYLIQMWISLLPAAFLLYALFVFPNNRFSFLRYLPIPENLMWLYYFLMPIFLFGVYYLTVIWTALITKIILWWYNIRRPAKEGVFTRSSEDLDYVYWNKRNLARVFLIWLLYTPPFPWGKTFFTFRFFGIKIGKNTVVTDCWISPEFIEIGNNTKIGQGSAVVSYVFEKDKLIVARVKIEENCIIGPRTVVEPGCIIHNNCTVSACSLLLPFTELDPNAIYFGLPVEKVRDKTPEDNL
jgi:acetyltransferase-like isoleucine patch superfamily enzyme